MGTKKIQTARKVYECGKCKKKILKGEQYIKFTPSRFQKMRKRCMGCPPTRSELTTSDFLAEMYSIEDEIQSIVVKSPQVITKESIDGLKGEIESEIESIKSRLEDLQSETQDRHDNIPDNLQNGMIAEMLQGRCDSIDEMMSDLDGIDISLDFDDLINESKEEKRKISVLLDEKLEEILSEINDICYNGE